MTPRVKREFYWALMRHNDPTEMVLYPRMPHFRREPRQLVDMTPRMLDWFDEHLGRSAEASEEASGE